MSGWDLIASARGSRHKIKRSGQKGQPCLVPLDIGKEAIWTCDEGLE